MARVKYFYNTKTCRYEPVSISRGKAWLQLLLFLFAALILAFGITSFYQNNFTSIKESVLAEKNYRLKIQYEGLKKDLEKHYAALEDIQTRDDHIYRVILDTDPLPQTVREAGTGGHSKYEELLNSGLEQKVLILEAYARIDRLKKQMYIQTRSFDDILNLEKERAKMWASMPAIQPINNKELRRLHYTFGMRMHPILRRMMPHNGLDFSAPTGTPVYTTGDGVVRSAYYSTTFGKVVFVDHGYGYVTVYAHLSEFNVEKGDAVKRGDLIGLVGNTGRSKGPHLHYEVRYNGKPMNPIHYFHKDLDNEEYERLIRNSLENTTPLGGD